MSVGSGRHGAKRRDDDPLQAVQERNRRWWESTPMTYDWRGEVRVEELSEAWFDEQDRRSAQVHAHFATETTPFDRLIPFERLRGKQVLEIGVGAGFHAELLARAGAVVTGIDLTDAAVARTRRRFELRGLAGTFERRDAEERQPDFDRRFDFVWSWGVIHHSARTARIVRNVSQWLDDDGSFGGMVYHRDSTSAVAAIVRDGLLRARLRSQSVDELLWRSTDGYSARFYPAEQWRDLLLAFFERAEVAVTGVEADAAPLPRRIRRLAAERMSPERRDRILGRAGSFVTFDARDPLPS
jgi:2-polyprenyl-3-methyl-5-hydroxy-6-metoxy-1,4-benzoquinol methylase